MGFAAAWWFLSEKLNGRAKFGVVLGIIGAVAMTYTDSANLNVGALAILSAGVISTASSLLAKVWSRDSQPSHLAFYRALTVFISVSLVAVCLGEPVIDGVTWLPFIAGIVGPFLNYIAFYSALRLLPISAVVSTRPAVTALVLAVGVVYYRELPELLQLIGGSLVILSVALVLSSKIHTRRGRNG